MTQATLFDASKTQPARRSRVVVCVIPDPPPRKPAESPGVAAALERARQFAAEYLDGWSQTERLGVLAGLCIQRVTETNVAPWQDVFGDEWQSFHWITASKFRDLLAYLDAEAGIVATFGVDVPGADLCFGPLETLTADDLQALKDDWLDMQGRE